MSPEIATTDPLAGVLAELAPRQVAHDKIDHEGWLRARLFGVTATLAKVCLVGTNAEKAAELKKKLEGDPFTGTKNTDFGSAREAYLLDQAGATPYGYLVHAPGNKRHLATPDGLRKTWGGFAVVESKTSKYDIRMGSPKFDAYGYLWQILWQMYCTASDEFYYVWEQHDDDWSRWNDRPRDRPDEWHLYGPGRVDGGVEHGTLAGLEDMLKKQIAAADRFLVRLDKAVAELRATRAAEIETAAEPTEEEAADQAERTREDSLQLANIETQGRLYRNGLDAEKVAKESAADARAQLLKVMKARYGEEPGEHFFAASREEGAPTLRAGYTPAGTSTKAVPDEDAAKAAAPELWAQVEEERTKLRALEDQWNAHQSNHQKTVTSTGGASVRVTVQKEKKQ